MYDLHAHILPGVDDGAKTPEDTVAMARVGSESGTRVILCTPHRRDITENWSVDYVRALLDRMNSLIQKDDIQLSLKLGMENHLDLALAADVQAGKALPMNGSRYILVELDFFQYPSFTDEVIFQLQIMGLTPVIAHPERQAQLQANPGLLVPLIANAVFRCSLCFG